MMPDTTVRTLRQVAEVLRAIHLWDDEIERELEKTSKRLDVIADCMDDKVIEFPRSQSTKPSFKVVNGTDQ